MQIREIIFEKEIHNHIGKNKKIGNDFFQKNNIKIAEGIYFQDDNWDFNNKNTINRDKSLYRYDFSQIDYRYKSYFKKLILSLLIVGKKSASTVRGSYYSDIKRFIYYLQNNNMYSHNRITKGVVEEYFKKQNWTERTKDRHRKSLIEFLALIEESSENLNYSAIYNYLNTRDTGKKIAQIEAGKTKIIPSNIFDKMVSLALKDIDDISIRKKDKFIACMIIILAETGMRIGEFVRLEHDKINQLKIDKKRKVDYLEFITYKIRKNKNTEYRWTETYLSDKAKLAYEVMCELSPKSTYKYIYYMVGRNPNHCDEGVARVHIYRFILRHYNELGFDKIKNKDSLNVNTIKKGHISLIGTEYRDMIGKDIYIYSLHTNLE